MTLNKRAAAMISFHWLLVIIGGGAVFVLFGMFINTGQQTAESSLSVNVLLHFDTIFSSFVTTEKTEASLPSRNDIELDFTCVETNDDVRSSFRLSGGVTKGLDNIIIFSKDHVAGESIFTTARNFAVPFSVSTLLYVSDPNILYVIESPIPDDVKKIKSLLHPNATIITLGEDGVIFLNQIKLKDYRDVVIIGHSQSVLSSFGAIKQSKVGKNSNIYLYEIIANDDLLSSGSVQGYEMKIVQRQPTFIADGKPIEYNHPALLAGVIYSNSAEWYSCVMSKIHTKIARVSKVLAERADYLALDANVGNNICKTTYENARDELLLLGDDPQGYYLRYDTIETYNKRLERQSCPLLY